MKSRKFKWASPLFIIFLALAGVFSVGGVMAAKQAEKAPVVQRAEAASATIYFVPNSNWQGDIAAGHGNKIMIDFRDGSDNWLNKRYAMTKESYTAFEGRYVYKYYMSDMSGIGKIHFAEFLDGTEKNYSGACNYDGSNFYYIDNSSSWGSQTVSPSNHLPDRIVTTVSGASSSTGRVVMNNYGSGWTDGHVGVRVWGGSAAKTTGTGDHYDATIYCTNWIQDKDDDDSTWYGYTDIPTNATGFQFVKLSAKNKTASIWNYQKGDGYTVSSGCFSVVYYISNGWSSSADISTGGAKNDKAYANLLSTVYAAYNTCSDSNLNGYNCATDLNTYFYSHAQADPTVTSMGTGALSKKVSVHQAAMAARKAGGTYYGTIIGFSPLSLFGDSEDNLSTIIIIAASSVALLSVTALSILVLKKRKRKEQ